MFNKLIAENIVKIPFKGESYFSINKKFIAYPYENAIRIKSLLNKDIKEYQIILDSIPVKFQLSFQQSIINILSKDNILQIYKINIENNIVIEKILELKGVILFKEVQNGLSIIQDDSILKFIQYSTLISQNIMKCGQKYFSIRNQGSGIFLETNHKSVDIYDKRNNQRYQKIIRLENIQNPLAIYKNNYLFHRKNQEIQIINVSDKIIIGKIPYQGEIVFASIKQNLFLLITNKSNVDYYYFYGLRQNPLFDESLIISKCIYEKAKGDCHNFINLSIEQSKLFLESKKAQKQINQEPPQTISNQTVSIIYVLSKQKQKVQMIKINHSKLLQQTYSQTKLNIIIQSNLQVNNQQKLQIEKCIIQASIEQKLSQQQVQKKFIENIIQNKLDFVVRKFQILEKKVQNLQKTIKNIYNKLQQSLQTINNNKNQVKKNVSSLFQQITPQFQRYFAEIFKQVAGVMEQGAAYYNYKLAKQAQLHTQVLKEIITLSFKATQQIVDLNKKQLKFSEKIQQHLKTIAILKKNWIQATDSFEVKVREIKKEVKKDTNKDTGKIFYRTDLDAFQRRNT